MCKIAAVRPEQDYKLRIDFDDGSQIIYNMQKLVRTMPYNKLNDWELFQKVRYDEKSVYWETQENKPQYFPLRLNIDTILFSLRG